MMDFLFGILLVPFFPQLDDPQENYAATMDRLEQRLNAGQWQVGSVAEPKDSGDVQLDSALSVRAMDLPPITGRLFQWSGTQSGHEANRQAAVNLSLQSLRLTGLIESAGQQVAILNDGQVDHVVGVGSYVLDTYRVTSFGPGQVVLSPLDPRAGGKRLELSFMPVNSLEVSQ